MNKTLTKFFAVIGVISMLGGAVIGGMELWAKDSLKPSNWGNSTTEQGEGDKTPEPPNGETTAEVGSFVVQAPETNGEAGINFAMALSDETEVESSVTITATLFPSLSGSLEWSVEFANPQSAWARNKTVTNYVTVTWTGKLTCRVDCLQAFGEQIIVKAVLVENSTITASCSADYRQKLEVDGIGLQLKANEREYNYFRNQMFFNLGTMPNFNDPNATFHLSNTYTLPFNDMNSVETKVFVKIHETLKDNMENAILHGGMSGAVGAKDWELLKTATLPNLCDYYDGEHGNLPLGEINSAEFISKLYPIMLNGGNGLNSYVNQFVARLNSVLSNPLLSEITNSGQTVPVCYVKTVFTINGVSYEHVSTVKADKEYVSVQKITLDNENIEF